MKEGHFEINDQQLIGNADNAPALSARFSLNIEGQDFDIIKPVRQKYTDPVKGELYQPLSIVPPVVITPSKNLLLSASPAPQSIRLTVRAMKDTHPMRHIPRYYDKLVEGLERSGLR